MDDRQHLFVWELLVVKIAGLLSDSTWGLSDPSINPGPFDSRIGPVDVDSIASTPDYLIASLNEDGGLVALDPDVSVGAR